MVPSSSKHRLPSGLKQLLIGAGSGILTLSAVIAIYFLSQAYKTRQLTQFEADELLRYEIALKAVSAVSAERGPANNAMTGTGPGVIDALRQKRAETDQRLGALQDAFKEELTKGGVYFVDYALLGARLRSARYAVDKIAKMPLERRTHKEVQAAIEAMFTAADISFSLRDKLGKRIVADTQLIAADILLLNEAGRLRELTGRLGSSVVLLLGDPGDASTERAAITTIRSDIAAVWQNLDQFAPAHYKIPEVASVVDKTRQSYFSGSLLYLNDVLRRHDAGEPISAKDFTDQYVGGLKSTDELRAEILRATLQTADTSLHGAHKALLFGTISFAMICLLLAGLAIATRRLLFAPLLSARNEIMALAAGDLCHVGRTTRASRELEDVHEGIGILRQQLLEKRSIEQEQMRLMETLRFLSERDPLTQLLNRRAVEDIARMRMREADINRRPLGVLIVDLDHFKRINDTYGHATGDLVLKGTADQMTRTLRATDVVARFGGEEFVVILDLNNEEQALEIAERLRQGIATMELEHETNISVTASVGLCVRAPGSSVGWDEIVAAADQRLYIAKAQGRNRVCAGDDGALGSTPAMRKAALPSAKRLRAVQ